jgi:hypothetical protein
MLDISLGGGGTFFVLWKPQTRSVQLRASIPPPHLALRGQSATIAHHTYPQHHWPDVSSCSLFPDCCLSISRPSHDRVSGACAAAVAVFAVAPLQIFFRLRRACGGFFFACGGPRRAIFGAAFSGGFVFSSRSARRAARAWRLRPARGMAPRVPGSRQGVLWTGDRAMLPSLPPPPPPQAFASTCPQGTQRLRPCRRSEAAPLALGLATQAALRPRSTVLGIGLSAHCCRVLCKI